MSRIQTLQETPADEPLARPLPLAAAGVLAGVGIAAGVRDGAHDAAHASLAFLFVLAALYVSRIRSRSPRSRRFTLRWVAGIIPFSAFAILGAARVESLPAPWGCDSAACLPQGDDGGDSPLVQLEGTVASPLLRVPDVWREAPAASEPPASFELEDLVVLHDGKGHRVDGLARVAVVAPRLFLPRGVRVRLLGRLRRVPLEGEIRNPGEPDHALHLRLRGIVAVVALDSTRTLEVISDLPSWRGVVDRLRQHLVDRFASELDPKESGLAAALLLGVRDGLDRRDPNFVDAIAGSGTVHLLAISGMQVAWLVLFVRGLLGLAMRPSVADGVAFLFALVYADLAGADSPVLRAAVAAVLGRIGVVLGRPPRSIDALAIAAILLVLHSPDEAMRPGFQLSFLACFALLTREHRKLPSSQRRMLRAVAGVYDALSLSVRVSLLTVPLVANQFGTLAPLGALLTLLLTPPFVVAFCLVTLHAVLGGVVPGIAPLTNVALEVLARAFEFGANLPGSSVFLRAPCAVSTVLFVCGMGLVQSMRVKPWRLVGLLILTGTLIEIERGRSPSSVELVVLDVGHGQAALLRLTDGQTLLFDCGAMEQRTTRAPARRASQIVRRACDELGCFYIDRVVVSHGDADHVNGLPRLLAQARIRSLVHGDSFEGSAAREVLQAAKATGVSVETARRDPRGRVLFESGGRSSRDPHVVVSSIAPALDSVAASSNDRSLVVRIDIDGKGVLLPGDIETDGIVALLDSEPFLAADVVLLPHHGHDAQGLSPLLHRLKNALWIASRGKESSRPDLAHLLAKRFGSTLLTTPRCGAITVRFRTGSAPRAETSLERAGHAR